LELRCACIGILRLADLDTASGCCVARITIPPIIINRYRG